MSSKWVIPLVSSNLVICCKSVLSMPASEAWIKDIKLTVTG